MDNIHRTGDSGDSNRRDKKGKGRVSFSFKNGITFRRKKGKSGGTGETGESSQAADNQRNTEREKHEGFHKRISALLKMEDNKRRQELWRYMKNDEKDDIDIYRTPKIQESLIKKREAIDDEEAEMIDKNVPGSNMGERTNEMGLEYDQQEMLFIIGEINRRLGR